MAGGLAACGTAVAAELSVAAVHVGAGHVDARSAALATTLRSSAVDVTRRRVGGKPVGNINVTITQ